MYVLTWCSAGVRTLDASGPGFSSTRGTTFFFNFFFWIFYFPVIFFQIIITSQSLWNNLKYIAGFKLFSVSDFLHSPTESVFHIYQEHRKLFGLKAVRLTKFNFIDHLLSLNKPCWYYKAILTPESMFHSIQTIKDPHKFAYCIRVFPNCWPFSCASWGFVIRVFSLAQHSIF